MQSRFARRHNPQDRLPSKWARLTPLGLCAALGLATASFGQTVDDAAATAEDAPAAKGERAPAAAADSGGVVTLEETVITATRTELPAFDTPYTVHTVDGQDVIERSYRSAPDALREVPGVLVQKTAYGQGSPFIRGFTGFRTLLLVDGIRLNNSTFREGPNQYFSTVDLLSVDRFEVVKGPSSVLYGSDAIGGTVNAITKRPGGYGDGFQWDAGLYQRGASAERSYIGHPEVSVTFDRRLGFFAAGSAKEFGDLRGGEDIGRQENTGYDEWDVDFKAEYFLNPDARLVLAHQRVQQNEVPRTHSTVFAESFAGSAVGSDLRRDLDQDRELTYLQYHATNLGDGVSGARASLSWQEQRESEHRIRGNGTETLDGFDAGTVGFWVQFDSPTPIGLFTYGLEYYHDNVNSFSSANPIQGPVGDDASYDVAGVFVQDRIPLSERLELTLGTRFNYARAEADGVQDPETGERISVKDDWESLVGSARVAYFVVPEHWNLFGGVSQGFRAPNLSDLTRLDFARSNELEVPAPGLDPEHYVSYEVGVKAEYEQFALQVAYFYTDIRDMIIRVPTGEVVDGDSVVTKLNAGDGYVQGIEVGGSVRLDPDWTAFGSVAWQDGEVDTFPTSAADKERAPLSRLIPTTGLVGLRWDHPRRHVFLEGVLTVADEQDDLSPSDEADTQRIPPGGTPGYEVLSLRGGWRINEHALLTLALENVTDEDYRIHGSGVNEPGRNFVAALQLNF